MSKFLHALQYLINYHHPNSSNIDVVQSNSEMAFLALDH